MAEFTFSGARVRELRHRAELTQKELALAAGVSVRSVAYYEAGRLPAGRTLHKLARALGVRVVEFYEVDADERVAS